MFQWLLITHNSHAYQWVTGRLQQLGVEYYSPMIEEVKKRKDCAGTRKTLKPLFPGYLFVRIDPEVVHTSTITDIPGVKEFVSFGGIISIIPNATIDALKQSLLLRTDKKVRSLECRNVPPAIMNRLAEIAAMTSIAERKTSLFILLQQESELLRLSSRPYSRIASVTERPHVNEKLG